MVDVDRRTTTPGGGLTPSHAAGLRRLSSRASNPSSTARLAGIHSFAPLASSLASSLKSSGVLLSPGLTEPELARIESHFGLTFPPDLRALLFLSLPSSPGFPNWRSSRLPFLRPLIDLPIAAVSLQIAANSFWPKFCGPRPADPAAALLHTRSALRRAPLLIPIFHRCYIPSLPSLAGNPVFFVDDHQISLCGLDLADFFSRFLRSPAISLTSAPPRSKSLPRGAHSLPKKPRWIEFWSDAAACDRKRWSSSSTSDPERFVEIRMAKLPEWLRGYLDRIGSVLKDGGWEENDVNEMVEVSAAAEMADLAVDGQAMLDVLLLKADRCSDSLRRAGWSSEEVSDVLGFDFRLANGRKKGAEVKLPAEIRIKIEKLAEAVSRS